MIRSFSYEKAQFFFYSGSQVYFFALGLQEGFRAVREASAQNSKLVKYGDISVSLRSAVALLVECKTWN